MEDNPDGLSSMPRWQQMQYKSFRAWVNYNLTGSGLPEVVGLGPGLKDGLALAKLLENLSKQTIKGINKNPKLRIHHISNLSQIFDFIKSVPIKVVSIQPEDIADGNVKLVLGFIWVLILHYQIAKASMPKADDEHKTEESKPAPKEDPKALLLARVNNFLVAHGLAEYQVKNFVEDWQSGTAFNSLIFAQDSSLVQFHTLFGKPALDNLSLAFGILKEEWGLPHMLEPDDFVSSKPDEKSVMTYVSLVLDAFEQNKRTAKKAPEPEPVKEDLPPIQEPAPPVPVVVEPPPVVETPPVVEEPPPKPKKVFRTVHVRIAAAKDIKKADKDSSDPYVVLEFHHHEHGKKGTGKELKTQTIKHTQNPEWNEDFSIEASSVDLSPSDDELVFRLFDWDAISKNDPIGVVELPVDKLEEGVVFDQWLPIKKKLHKKKLGHGELHVLVTVNEMPLPPLGHTLYLRVAGARDIKAADKSGFSDAYVIVKIDGKKDKKNKLKTQVIKQTLKPEWNEEFVLEGGSFKPESDVLAFHLYDWDKASKKDPLGVVFVPIKDIAAAPGGIFDQWLQIKDHKKHEKKGHGEFHVVASLFHPLPRVEIPSWPIKLRITEAKDLLGADKGGTSDPYAVFEIAGKKVKHNKTKAIDKTLNPVWDEEFEFESGFVNVLEDVLEVTIYDKDKVGENTPLGYVAFPFKLLLERNVRDEWFPLNNPAKRDQRGHGELRLQVAFGAGLPPAAETVTVAVVAGRDLKVADKGGTSDPYVIIRVPGKKPTKLALKTPHAEKTLSPVWNQDFEFQVRDFDRTNDVLEFHIFDWDKVGDNDPLGVVAVPFSSIYGTPFTDKWYPVQDEKKRDKPGQGELNIRFAFGEEGAAKLNEAYGNASRPETIGGKDARWKVSEEEVKKLKKEKEKAAKKKEKEEKDKKKGSSRKKSKGDKEKFDRKAIAHFRIRVGAAKDLPVADKGGSSDPYVVIGVPGTEISHKTKTVKKTVNPVWNEEFNLSKDHIDAEKDVITFSIFDWDMVSKNDLLGFVKVPAKELLGEEPVDKWFPVMDPEDHEKKGQGELHIAAAHGDADLPAATDKKSDKKSEKKKEKEEKKKEKEDKKKKEKEKKEKEDKKKAKDDKKKGSPRGKKDDEGKKDDKKKGSSRGKKEEDVKKDDKKKKKAK